MEIKEKVAHLKGLMEGMEYDTTTKEGKIISSIVDILGDMSEEIDCFGDDIDALYDYADELDSDLGDVESDLYGDVDDDDYSECADCEADDCTDCPSLKGDEE